MTNRTASLLLLFVAGLGATGVLAALIQGLALRGDPANAWLLPAVAMVCYTATLFFGRHQILPHDIAKSRSRTMVTLAALIGACLGALSVVVWVVTTAGVRVRGGVVIALGFAALWLALRTLHRTSWRLPLP